MVGINGRNWNAPRNLARTFVVYLHAAHNVVTIIIFFHIEKHTTFLVFFMHAPSMEALRPPKAKAWP